MQAIQTKYMCPTYRQLPTFVSNIQHPSLLQMPELLDQLPDGSTRDMHFYDSSFFKDPGNPLPTPRK